MKQRPQADGKLAYRTTVKKMNNSYCFAIGTNGNEPESRLVSFVRVVEKLVCIR